MKTKWSYSGDVNMLDYGGKNMRHIGNGKYQIVELINMDYACGRDNEGQPKYVVELRLVDLASISANTLASALECCGQNREELTDDCKAECCDSYGARAPLGSWCGNNARKLLRQAYQEANSLLDESALESKLDCPVNKIGSSAREVMNGDFMSAIQRGVESGNTDALLMAKIHGVPHCADGIATFAPFVP